MPISVPLLLLSATAEAAAGPAHHHRREPQEDLVFEPPVLIGNGSQTEHYWFPSAGAPLSSSVLLQQNSIVGDGSVENPDGILSMSTDAGRHWAPLWLINGRNNYSDSRLSVFLVSHRGDYPSAQSSAELPACY